MKAVVEQSLLANWTRRGKLTPECRMLTATNGDSALKEQLKQKLRLYLSDSVR